MTAHRKETPVPSSQDASPSAESWYLWRIAITAALGGLLFGYDWVVIGGARQFYEQYFRLTSAALIGWANSCALVGCLVGSAIAGSLAFRYGRRKVLLLSAVLFAISSGMTGWASEFSAFIAWRIAGGVAIGLASNVAPLYIAEISPAAVRGRLVSLNQFAIVVGILAAQIVNWLIARPMDTNMTAASIFASWNVQYAWRWMFTAVIAPSVVFTIASLFLPESPRWLLVKRRQQEARAVLERIGGGAYAQAELAAIEQALLLENSSRSSLRELLSSGIRRMLLIGIALAVLQQWTGINVIFNYAGDVYRGAGFAANDIFLDIVVTGVINLVFTILAMLLVDRLGRRPLMIFGCLGIAAAHLLCAAAYHAQWRPGIVLTLTLAAIGCYAMSLAPVTWVVISEVFPNRIRGAAMAVAVSFLWIACFILTYTFPFLNAKLGSAGTFWLYAAICVGGFLFILWKLPETKGKTLEEIERDLVD